MSIAFLFVGNVTGFHVLFFSFARISFLHDSPSIIIMHNIIKVKGFSIHIETKKFILLPSFCWVLVYISSRVLSHLGEMFSVSLDDDASEIGMFGALINVDDLLWVLPLARSYWPYFRLIFKLYFH
jgi:hypothetical protein